MKYFVISDIHSYYTELKEALKEAGYDKSNPDHMLILCGDCLDRGDESVQVIKFLRSIPKQRRVFIRGNHEYLFADLLKKDFPESYDFSNGTVNSFCNLADVKEEVLSAHYYYALAYTRGEDIMKVEPYDEIQRAWKEIKNNVAKQKLADWFLGPDWVDYYEIENFIFVHSFIPLNDTSHLPAHYLRGHNYSYNPDWRQALPYEWEGATWGCPWMLSQAGLNKTGKTIVCGHWHASDFHDHLPDDPLLCDGVDPRNENEIYFSKDIIAIDACTARSGFCNVLVIEGNQCYDRHGNPLPFTAFQEPDISLKSDE